MAQTYQPTTFRVAGTRTYVKIRYRVGVENGPVLKGAGEPEVMDFVTGFGHVIPGLERRVVGHCPGDKLSFTVPPEEAFGQRSRELVIEKSKKDFHFPKGMEPYPGMELPLVARSEGAPDTVIVREVRDETIVIDFNHPLAGAPLQYELEIVEARPAGEKDICSEWQEVSDSRCGACSSNQCAPAAEDGVDRT
ncbi:MAG: FKBP-type peptidyl-prolyl cis-trans isomerase [Deltaproteobacteria bacterium]|nr:FKBP-type peptidyl-prolyl cis-trans isomerase [Deltaproteobacteria bacterium]